MSTALTSEAPDAWLEVMGMFEGTAFQSFIEKLSSLGFLGDIISVVIMMALTVLVVSAAVFLIRGCIYLFKKLILRKVSKNV